MWVLFQLNPLLIHQWLQKPFPKEFFHVWQTLLCRTRRQKNWWPHCFKCFPSHTTPWAERQKFLFWAQLLTTLLCPTASMVTHTFFSLYFFLRFLKFAICKSSSLKHHALLELYQNQDLIKLDSGLMFSCSGLYFSLSMHLCTHQAPIIALPTLSLSAFWGMVN